MTEYSKKLSYQNNTGELDDSAQYQIPHSESSLWRYMDFTKYVSMLSTSSLYFARADTLDDHFEGAKGTFTNKEKWDVHFLSFFRNAVKNPPDGNDVAYTDEEIDKIAIDLLNQLDKTGEYLRKQTFINCWHENEYESEAMWRLYSSYINNAIAIKTTFKSLSESLSHNSSIRVGKVDYIDFDTEFAGVNNSFWKKRKSFEHEREVRALLYDFDCTEAGINIVCALDELIKEVYVSPQAPTWFVDLIKNINTKFELEVNVHQSSLNAQPFY